LVLFLHNFCSLDDREVEPRGQVRAVSSKRSRTSFDLIDPNNGRARRRKMVSSRIGLS